MNIIDLFFPKHCLGCRKAGTYLCATCAQQLTQKDLICPICTHPAFGGNTHPLCQRTYGLDGLWSLGAYQGALRTTILKLKYKFVSQLRDDLVDLIVHYWVQFPPLFLDQIKQNGGVDWLIVPVPLHPARQNWRGFNQSALIAQQLAISAGLNYSDCLLRTKNTQPQAQLDGADRRHNIQNAFILVKNADIRGKNILLLDDVWTTGSTIKECGYILKRNGASKVWAITLAR